MRIRSRGGEKRKRKKNKKNESAFRAYCLRTYYLKGTSSDRAKEMK